MTARTRTHLVLTTLLIIPLCCVIGCDALNQHGKMMDSMRGAMSDTAGRLSESGTGQLQAGGQVITPGIRVAGGVEYYAEARYLGVAGQVSASMAGGLDRPVPPEVQARADAIWRDTSLSDAEKLAALRELLLGWLSQPAVKEPEVSPAEDSS